MQKNVLENEEITSAEEKVKIFLKFFPRKKSSNIKITVQPGWFSFSFNIPLSLIIWNKKIFVQPMKIVFEQALQLPY